MFSQVAGCVGVTGIVGPIGIRKDNEIAAPFGKIGCVGVTGNNGSVGIMGISISDLRKDEINKILKSVGKNKK